MAKFRDSLSRKIIISFIVILLPVFIAFVAGYRENSERLNEGTLEGLTAIAEVYEGAVYQFLEMARRRAMDFSSDGFIRENLKRITDGDEQRLIPLGDHLIKNKLTLDNTLHAIYIMTTDGRVLVSTDGFSIGKEFLDSSLLEKAKSHVTVSELSGQWMLPKLLITSPILSIDTRRPIGIIANVVLFTELNKIMTGEFSKDLGAITWDKGRKKTMEVYLVDRDRLLITEPVFLKGTKRRPVNTMPVNLCLASNTETAGVYKNYMGVEVFGASMCMPELNWTLLVEVYKDEALFPQREMLKHAVIAGAIVIGLIGAVFMVFFRDIVIPIKKISNALDDIISGNYEVSVPVKTRDEVGSLAQSFNAMAKEIKTRTEALKKSQESLEEAQKIMHLGNWDWDMVKNEFKWSKEIYRIFGVKEKGFDITYDAFLGMVHPSDRGLVRKAVAGAIYDDQPYSIVHRVVLPDLTERLVHEQGAVVRDFSGAAVRMLGTVQDVTEEKKRESELRKLSVAMEKSINMIILTDRSGTIEYVNPMFEEVSGYKKEEIIGQNPRVLSSGETTKEEYEELWKTILQGRTWRGVLKNKKKNKELYWVNSLVTPIRADGGDITHFLAIQEDITESIHSKEKAHYLLEHDELTGLYNRAHFMRVVEEWLGAKYGGEAPARQKQGALFLINIDHFKDFNDTYGHVLGDEFLRASSRMLTLAISNISLSNVLGYESGGVGRASFAGRLGSDEFSVFIPFMDEKGAGEISDVLRKIFEDIRLADRLGSLTVSIGAVIYPVHGITTRELFTKADAALHRAKELGGNRCHIYHPPDDAILEDMHSRLKWRDKVIKAIENKRFEPWFQPIMSLKDSTVRHYEVLARMRGEDGVIVPPSVFIDIAERFGIIDKIDMLMVDKAINILAEIRKRRGVMLFFTINLSGKYIGQAEFLSFLQAVVKNADISPGQLIFEITETAALKDIVSAMKFMEKLRALGCSFALDDFGVGFTSFTYLKQLEVDYIKIDGSFVRKLNENQQDRLFVRAIVDVAKGLNIKTIAEMVENKESLEMLKTLDVDYAQGFYLGKPMPVFGLKDMEGASSVEKSQ